ncbi:Carbamoyl-phosphate synthase arginine-specific large chain [Zancudomyces culisetae]|uniref:Carbamoyl phosphate synthase arginine-specific large chain n=1 Tax=Zancudomyces culisetae TaxID=1213189 RepID=A0A1R1PP65_ZANCU|nr:Carbamoyl-phosphate synthase arginine-specific large chain [Zancudomyces culisetae]|eukprot:OMH82775.1 Carbamoyl-phosphate synthase arginine-specific large chain [Zancudomyces culisetae]
MNRLFTKTGVPKNVKPITHSSKLLKRGIVHSTQRLEQCKKYDLAQSKSVMGSGRMYSSVAGTSVNGMLRSNKFMQATKAAKSGGKYVGVNGYRGAVAHYSAAADASMTSGGIHNEKQGAVSEPANKVDVKKVLVVGSGGLTIGQAGEFDYSGSQAIKALKESNIEVILINPNIATVQTSHELADSVYFVPVTPEYLEKVIEKEKPDGIMLAFGGQTALNCGVALNKMGVLDKHNVKVLGTSVRTLELSEDRDLFAQALKSIGIPVAESIAVNTVDDALKAARDIGYPVIVRSAYALGGLGSGFAETEQELRQLSGQSLSLAPQILVEKSMKGWKEIEYEVVRDAADNCVTVCNMENFDPLGIHTGDSIVVAPSQTLSDAEYHMLRTAAIKIVRHMGVVGECNVQYALNPKSMEYCVIEMNARLSRSSALASKATGYPLAFVAAKIGLGWTLPELQNSVTTTTTACFEPSLDYIVTKIPRWDLAKFNHVSRAIGSSMKSVGEVMAIGRTFEESLQKAIRQVDPSFAGFDVLKDCKPASEVELDSELQNATDRRLFYIAHAMIDRGYSADRIHRLTGIDMWFLQKLENLVNTQTKLGEYSTESISKTMMEIAKRNGFSDAQIAKLVSDKASATEDTVREKRKELGITPFVKRIDTLAGEFPAPTNYLYTTYNASTNDVEFTDKGYVVLGSGVYRIGSSVEFDWCAVSAVRTLRQLGHKTVMINYNPETVSTDFDECDRLYFDELSLERVKDIYELENSSGVFVSVGGQLPQNIALKLHQTNGFRVMGTDPEMIDAAEDRHRFSSILDQIGVDQPAWKELRSYDEAMEFAEQVGYPVLVRPSYVLSGAAMNVAHDAKALHRFLALAASVSPLHPVVMTKFISNARELDIDAVAHKGKVLVHAISEHVEDAGVHSGDASLVLPPVTLSDDTLASVKTIADKVAEAFKISGPFNMQVIMMKNPSHNDQDTTTPPYLYKVIECNLRASRSLPFVSKVTDTNFVETAIKSILDKDVPAPKDLMAASKSWGYVATKVPQFSWTRLAGADPFLGVEMASTGEVACFGDNVNEAYLTSLLSTLAFRIPPPGSSVLVGFDALSDMSIVQKVVSFFTSKNYTVLVDNQEAYDLLLSSSSSPSALKVQDFAYTDKKSLYSLVQSLNLQFVVNLSKLKPLSKGNSCYAMRRMAVDFAIPLVNDQRCASLLIDSLAGVSDLSSKTPIPVKSWEEYLTSKK